MASWALVGVPAAVCGPVTMMSAAAASKGEKKGGLLDWLNGALDKESFSETDPILQKVEGGGGSRPAAPPPAKKASPLPKKGGGSNGSGGGGGGLFGLFGKK